jgi:hypothetical protein
MIDREKEDYLGRYYMIKIFGYAVFLHQFWVSDIDECHDHPWWNGSIILRGGYLEHFYDGTVRKRRPGHITLRTANTAHRLEIDPKNKGKVWTLFFHGTRKRRWGFYTKDGWVDAADYNKEPVTVYGRDYSIVGWLFPRVVYVV